MALMATQLQQYITKYNETYYLTYQLHIQDWIKAKLKRVSNGRSENGHIHSQEYITKYKEPYYLTYNLLICLTFSLPILRSYKLSPQCYKINLRMNP